MAYPVHGGIYSVESFPYCSFPTSLMVQTTSRCNAACVFCPYPGVSREIQHGEMSFSMFAKLMKECARYPEVKSINLFLMNEPLMDSQIAARLDYAKDTNPEAAICLWTNGCGLDEQLSRRIILSGLDAIGISIHAQWAETYRQLTGRGDFDRVLRRVTRFVELRNELRPGFRVDIRLVGVQQFLSPEEVDEAVEYWGERGVSDVESLLGHVNRAGNLPGTYGVVHRQIAGCTDRMPYQMAAILYTGEVVMCCMDWRREGSMGNIKTESLARIWRSDRRRRLMAMLQGERDAPADFLCKRCEESIPGAGR